MVLQGFVAAKLVSPASLVASVEVASISIPAQKGIIEVGFGHTGVAGLMSPGVIALKAKSRKDYYFTSGGFFKVVENQVVLLSECLEFAKDIEASRAKKALERSEALLEKARADSSVDIPRALRSFKRAYWRSWLCAQRAPK